MRQARRKDRHFPPTLSVAADRISQLFYGTLLKQRLQETAIRMGWYGLLLQDERTPEFPKAGATRIGGVTLVSPDHHPHTRKRFYFETTHV